MMLEQATTMKAIAPESKIWVYRNLVQVSPKLLLTPTTTYLISRVSDSSVVFPGILELRPIPREARRPSVRRLVDQVQPHEQREAHAALLLQLTTQSDPLQRPVPFAAALDDGRCGCEFIVFNTKFIIFNANTGDDCGDVIPCGDYVFDHRNASLREWIVKEHMLGSMGLGHPAVDGFGCIDGMHHHHRANPNSARPHMRVY